MTVLEVLAIAACALTGLLGVYEHHRTPPSWDYPRRCPLRRRP